MATLDRHHVRLPVLRFAIDLFDKSVIRQIVLDEEDEDFDSTIHEVLRDSPARIGHA